MDDFSILMSVYNGDKAEPFADALKSVLVGSSIKPTQTVLVVDGPISAELNKVIDVFESDLTVVRIKDNVGLSNALNIGLDHCNFDLIFRMDSDDISTPDRFELQLEFFKKFTNAAMCSSWVAHYDETMLQYLGDRKLPELPSEVHRYSFTRTPINHPATAFRKSFVMKAGGYPDTRLPFEDWWLSLRVIKYGGEIYNLPKYLVNVRASADFHARRSGIKYLISEYNAIYLMHKEKIISTKWALANLLIRTPFRLLPKSALNIVYKNIIRKIF
ncbi:glycosyltransferase [Pseudomonas mandelii]|uniref:glycosyltransferase n=1 Tax=Pseudomonas mandelii TaxID=75612 RepID=UPI00224B5B36|nr:glycosyltransferase [Pseudomonas mandelii]MCX2897812.1 glycosyltransferase [Pseudomonas mandelii]